MSIESKTSKRITKADYMQLKAENERLLNLCKLQDIALQTGDLNYRTLDSTMKCLRINANTLSRSIEMLMNVPRYNSTTAVDAYPISNN